MPSDVASTIGTKQALAMMMIFSISSSPKIKIRIGTQPREGTCASALNSGPNI